MKNLISFGLMAVMIFLAGCAGRPSAHVCSGCGEIKGSTVCCQPEGRTRCASCGLYEGAAACCKVPAGLTGDREICRSCGEIKGAAVCCNSQGRKICAKCGLFLGSVGCCKLVGH